jgi:ATP/ADP translocase
MIIAQFWSFANDLYTPDQGKRLFAIVGFGGSVGAIGGALIASNLITRVGLLPMMLIGSVELVIALVLTNLIHRREQRRPKAWSTRPTNSRSAAGVDSSWCSTTAICSSSVCSHWRCNSSIPTATTS